MKSKLLLAAVVGGTGLVFALACSKLSNVRNFKLGKIVDRGNAELKAGHKINFLERKVAVLSRLSAEQSKVFQFELGRYHNITFSLIFKNILDYSNHDKVAISAGEEYSIKNVVFSHENDRLIELILSNEALEKGGSNESALSMRIYLKPSDTDIDGFSKMSEVQRRDFIELGLKELKVEIKP